MSLEPAVQRAAGEPERLRRVAHVAGRARQRLLNEHPLHVLEAHLVERRGTVRPGAEPQVARSYRALLGHQHGPLDRVVELPHVPGPGIRPEGLHRVRREAANRLPVARGVAAPEMAGEQGNVLAPLAQRWQAEFDGIEAKQQVLPEFPHRRFGMDVRVRGRDDAHVHALRLGRANALELARLEHAQQLRLLRQGQIRNLVEKQRPALGELEPPDAIHLRVGEGPLHVPEQLALEQSVGNPAQVDGDEGPLGPARGGVQPAGDDLLASAVLAQDEHVGVRRADALHQLEHRLHGGRLGDQLGEALPAQRTVFALELLTATQRPTELDLGAECREQPAVVPRLLDEVARAAAHRLDGAVDAGPGGHHHDWGRGVEPLEPREQLESFRPGRRVAGVVQVDQEGVEVAGVQGGQHGARRGGGLHLVAFTLEEQLEGFEDVRFVVGDEDPGGSLAHGLKVSGVGGQGPGPARRGALTRPLGPRSATKIRSRPSGLFHYSVRSAAVGSTCMAWRAGTEQATSPTASSNAATVVRVAGSVGVTSYSMAARRRFASTAPTSPRTDPRPAIRKPRRITMRRTSRAVAPSAIRTPSSRVRWRTMVAMAPNRPTAASATALPAKTPSSSAFSRGCASGPSRYVPNGAALASATPGSASAITRRIVATSSAGGRVVRIASVSGSKGKNG